MSRFVDIGWTEAAREAARAARPAKKELVAMGKAKRMALPPGAYLETTPYGPVKGPKGWVVMQTWWNKTVAGPFASKSDAGDAAIEVARQNGALRIFRRKADAQPRRCRIIR